MAITINKDECIGCGACVALCPDDFSIDENGKAEVIRQENIKCAKNAADSCPVQAIKID